MGTFQGLMWTELHIDGGLLHCDRLGTGVTFGGACVYIEEGDQILKIEFFDDGGTAPTGEVDFFDDDRNLVGGGFPLCDGHGVYAAPTSTATKRRRLR